MSRDVLLDYVLKVSVNEVIPSASTAYLHNALVVAPLKSGQTKGIYTCTSQAEVAAKTDSKCFEMLNAGMPKIYVCAVDEVSEVQALLDASELKFFTLLQDPDFAAPDYTFTGVKAWASSTAASAKAFAAIADENNTGFVEPDTNGGANMFYAFGKLLSSPKWLNQQFVAMPEVGATSSLGTADQYFEDRVSFVLNSEEFGNRLAFFVNRGRAIVAPYIYEEFSLNMQSKALTYINANMPGYNKVEASKLETYLQNYANEKYVDTGLIDEITISVTADGENFKMSGDIAIAEPKATWRIDAILTEGI